MAELDNGTYTEVTVAPGKPGMDTTFVSATTSTDATASTWVPNSYVPEVVNQSIAHNVNVTTGPSTSGKTAQVASAGMNMLQLGSTLVLLAGLCSLGSLVPLMMHKRSLEQQRTELTTPVKKSTSRRPGESDEVDVPTTRFSDVAGANEAVASMTELVDFLADPDRYAAVGAQPPCGALLVGPPGTGKTLLARAVAGEAQVPFYAASGSDFVELYVGVGAKRVRELFAKARAHEKALVFIDEIDAIGKARSANPAGSDSERDTTLIALLTELDGFHESNIIVLAATNRPDILDSALTRPGRLDRQIQVPLPDRKGRAKILATHAATRPVADDVSYDHFARRTPGFSGADLAQLVNEAATSAARENTHLVTVAHFDSAVATVAMGVARTSAFVTDHDRRITAFHEAGHTVAALAEKDADPPVHVSIIPRGAAGGVTWMSESDNQFLTRTAAWSRLVVAMAGREAEKQLLAGDWTSGASSDLAHATNIATTMLTRYGMEHTLSTHDSPTSPEVRKVTDQMLDTAAARAQLILAQEYVLVNTIAQALLVDDDVDTAGLDRLVHHVHGMSIDAYAEQVRARLGSPAPPPGWLDEPATTLAITAGL